MEGCLAGDTKKDKNRCSDIIMGAAGGLRDWVQKGKFGLKVSGVAYGPDGTSALSDYITVEIRGMKFRC